jgi:pimeloyl-ACP methyl ester carboxylesterase
VPALVGGISGYVAGETHRVMLPGAWRANGTVRGVLHCAGLAGTADSLFASSLIGLPMGLAGAGLPVMSCDYGGNNLWGNATSNARMDSAWAYFKSAFGVRTDKVIVLGGSHGSVTALRWALANPTLVAALVLTIPAPNFVDLHDNDRGPGAKATLEAAWGTGTVASFVANSTIAAVDPFQNAAAYAALGLPIKGFYASDDPVALPAHWQSFAAAVGAQSQSLGAVGHSAATRSASSCRRAPRPPRPSRTSSSPT